jgi:hypothetical protein
VIWRGGGQPVGVNGEILRTVVGSGAPSLALALLSQRAVHRFLGYLNGQRERLLGHGRRSRVPNRPELVARYGYGVKYASDALRLAYQGLEIVRDGRLTLPMPDPERDVEGPAMVRSGRTPGQLRARAGDLLHPEASHRADRRAQSIDELPDGLRRRRCRGHSAPAAA